MSVIGSISHVTFLTIEVIIPVLYASHYASVYELKLLKDLNLLVNNSVSSHMEIDKNEVSSSSEEEISLLSSSPV